MSSLCQWPVLAQLAFARRLSLIARWLGLVDRLSVESSVCPDLGLPVSRRQLQGFGQGVVGWGLAVPAFGAWVQAPFALLIRLLVAGVSLFGGDGGRRRRRPRKTKLSRRLRYLVLGSGSRW